METTYVVAIAIVVIGVLIVVGLNRGRLESLGLNWGKLGFKLKARPDSEQRPNRAGSEFVKTRVEDKSTITSPSNVPIRTYDTRVTGGSQINIRDPQPPQPAEKAGD